MVVEGKVWADFVYCEKEELGLFVTLGDRIDRCLNVDISLLNGDILKGVMLSLLLGVLHKGDSTIFISQAFIVFEFGVSGQV